MLQQPVPQQATHDMDVANRMRCGMEDARSNSISDYKTTYRPLALIDRAVSDLLVGGQRVALRVPTSMKLLETNVHQVGLAAFGIAHDADERDESDDVGGATKDSATAIRSNTIRSNTIRSNTIRSNTIRSNTIRSNTIRSNTIRSNTIRTRLMQYLSE